jgi:mRNA-degrading endonuclease RelE of RelBE toxin-antitoxin system
LNQLGLRMYDIRYAEHFAEDLRRLRPAQRKQILDRIDAQLTYQPTAQTRNRKILARLVPPWEHEEPVWELRIGQFRVFYDVDEAEAIVIIRAIRHKPPHKTTEEIL